ncbi:hypothetical protein [Actinomadura rugatobispora]|uniref:Secreted protein n=1 Tax=Actinomadura rugatobispora TaxID=1994 RepID=A0ABW1AEE6_9ACTN
MARRVRGVVIVMAAALLVYLVMPNGLLSRQAGETPSTVSSSGGTSSAGALERPGPEEMTSDEVTMPPRDTLPDLSPVFAWDVPWLAAPAWTVPSERGPPGGRSGTWNRLAVLQPALSLLRVLRC